MADCVALARTVGRRGGEALLDPGLSLRRRVAPTRRASNLEDIRRGEFEGLAAKMAPEWAPDFGRSARRIRPPAPRWSARACRSSPTTSTSRPTGSTSRRRSPRRSASAAAASVREGDGHRARGSRDRPGLDEPDELREDADLPGVRSRDAAKRRATASTCSRARSSGWSRRPRSLTPPSTTCSSPGSRANRCWKTGSARRTPNVERRRRLDRLLLGLGAACRRDAERAHLAVQVAALDAEHFGGPRHVALLLGERAQDQIALELVARLVERLARPPPARAAPAGATAFCSRNARSTPEIESPGTMIISRSMTLRSSRTLPGHG